MSTSTHGDYTDLRSEEEEHNERHGGYPPEQEVR